jgi:FHA domain
MSMKSWVLHRVQGIGAAAGRADLPARGAGHGHEPALDPDAGARSEPSGFAEPALADVADLGAYAPLIRAVRDELEHFVASQVRLHVVIADRDWFTLTAIGVRSPGGAAARELLQRFMQEFRPEQVKRYLAREVIGRLPNAAVIDLSQFAGLCDLEARERAEEEGEYRELLAALRIAPDPAAARPYEISVMGRWSENDAASVAPRGDRQGAMPATPLAGRRCEFEIDDGGGPRLAVLSAVVPGRRYVVGKGADCELRVEGTYTSRRHAELWFERGTWYVADAGSTNGIRVEGRQAGAARPGRVLPAAAGAAQAIALEPGLRVVLSARADGPPGDYPWLALPAAPSVPRPVPATPVAMPLAAARAAPSTPRTAVLASRAAEPVFEIRQEGTVDARVHAIRRSELPITIGRSRGQTVVIDWSHEGVSGHHVVIDSLDEHAAHGVVEGDNGIEIDGVHHVSGARFEWPLGQSMVLGGALPGEPRCALGLARRGDD